MSATSSIGGGSKVVQQFIDGRGDRFPNLLGEVEEVATQFFFGDQVRGFVVVLGQAADRTDITGLGFGGITVQLHILDESSTYSCHWIPFWRGWIMIPGKGWIFERRS